MLSIACIVSHICIYRRKEDSEALFQEAGTGTFEDWLRKMVGIRGGVAGGPLAAPVPRGSTVPLLVAA